MTAQVPLVSIIMPAYNSAQFIGKAVESALQQTYPRCELIVINDGSTDETREVLRPFMGRIRYIDQERRGASAARNTGLAAASGEFIAFLDADDLLPRRAMEQRLARFAQVPSAAVVCSGWQIVDTGGRPIADVKPWVEGAQLDLISLLLHKQVLNGTITCRRECIDQVGGFDEELRHAQDIDLIFQIALAGRKLTWLREISILYRRRSDSASHQGPIQAQTMDRVLDKVFQSPQLPESARRREPEVRYYTHLWFAWHLAQLGYASEMRDRLRQALHSTHDPTAEISIHWLKIFSRWSAKFGYRVLKPDECYSAFREVLPQQGSPRQEVADGLEFWWRVWRHYLAGDESRAAQGLGHFKPAQLGEMVKWVQTQIFLSHEEVGQELIARFWSDARSTGIVSGAPHYEIATLHLSVCSRLFLGRRWIAGTRSLLAALSAGLHPKGVLAWYHFFRLALPYAIRFRAYPPRMAWTSQSTRD